MKNAWSTDAELALKPVVLKYIFLISNIILYTCICFLHFNPDFDKSSIPDDHQIIFNLISDSTIKIPSSLIEKQIIYDESIKVDSEGLIIDGSVKPDFRYNFCDTCKHNNTKDVIQFASRLKTTFLHLTRVYMAGSCHISDGRRVFARAPGDTVAYRVFCEGEIRSFVGNYDHAICVGHRWSSYYGHFITDYLCPLMCVPKEYWGKSEIIVGLEPLTKSVDHIFDLLTTNGIKREKIHILGRTEWVFCNNLYTVVDPPSYFSHPATCYVNLSKLLIKNLKLQNVAATRYVIFNRRPPANRRIENFDEIWETTVKTFPDIKWENIPDYYPNISSAAKEFCNVKFLYSITGSNIVRLLFMKKKSVIITIQLNWNEFNFQAMALALGIRYFTFSLHGYHHQFADTVKVDVNRSINAVKIGLYAAKYGHFPKPSLEYPYVVY